MNARQIVLDTETTGLEHRDGHRIIEIGCVELINRKLTGNNFHMYLNPQRKIDQGAIEVHGITNEFLQDKALFAEIAASLLTYLKGAELIIHNAAFDVGFLDAELSRLEQDGGVIADICTVHDTLLQARKMFPGQRNDLNSLCKRYEIDNSHRELHGALLDAEILADVYLYMTGGQTNILLESTPQQLQEALLEKKTIDFSQLSLPVRYPLAEEMTKHSQWVERLNESINGSCVWAKLNNKIDLSN